MIKSFIIFFIKTKTGLNRIPRAVGSHLLQLFKLIDLPIRSRKDETFREYRFRILWGWGQGEELQKEDLVLL